MLPYKVVVKKSFINSALIYQKSIIKEVNLQFVLLDLEYKQDKIMLERLLKWQIKFILIMIDQMLKVYSWLVPQILKLNYNKAKFLIKD